MAEQEFKNGGSGDKQSPCEVTFYLDEQAYNGISMHFSERGMLILCKDPAPLNAKLKLALRFPGLKNVVEINAEVVWTNIHGKGDSLAPKGMGVKFLNIEREMEKLFADLAGHYDSFGSIYTCYYT